MNGTFGTSSQVSSVEGILRYGNENLPFGSLFAVCGGGYVFASLHYNDSFFLRKLLVSIDCFYKLALLMTKNTLVHLLNTGICTRYSYSNIPLLFCCSIL